MTHSHLPAYKVSPRPCLLPLLHRNSRAGAIVEATCWGRQCRLPAQIPVWLYETESICWFWFHYLKDNLLSCSDSTVGCLCYGYCAFPLLREICGQLSSGELDACKESKGCSLQSLLLAKGSSCTMYIQCKCLVLKSLISKHLFHGPSDPSLAPSVASVDLLSSPCWSTKHRSSLKGQLGSSTTH